MKTYEYKTTELELPGNTFFGTPDSAIFDAALNAEGAKGWRYVGTIRETRTAGKAGTVLSLVFERETTPASRQRTKGVDPRT
jgi:hypothetical protein